MPGGSGALPPACAAVSPVSSNAPSPPPPRSGPGPVVFGVVGGIASGKSAVARRLAGPRGWVLDADELAHEALDELAPRVERELGPGLLDGAGRVDRSALARVVFADPEARSRLEGWIHPRVRATILGVLADAERQGIPRVVLDVPLLLENDNQHGLVARCHHLVFVDAPLEERDRRAARSRGWEPGEVARREAAQLSPTEKRERADFVVDNTGGLAELDAAVDRVLAEAGIE